jgi:hypothetical protein
MSSPTPDEETSQLPGGDAAEGSPAALLAVSVLIYSAALWVMILLHETSHAVAAYLYGARPVLHATSVEENLPTREGVVVALTGPVFSLLLGVVMVALQRGRPGLGGRGGARLFLLWFTLFNLYEFVGYLMTAPFLHQGDIRSSLDRLDAPVWVSWLVFVVGVAGWVALGRYATKLLLEAAGPDRPDMLVRLRFLGIMTWFAATALLLVLDGIVSGFQTYSVWATAAAGSYVCWVLPFLRRVHPRAVPAVRTPSPWLPLAAVALLFVVQLVWFAPGIRLG